jgi:putative ABC transport system permease protein
MWSIAIRTLLADRGKLLTALIGVIFSVVLVNVQGGLYLGLTRKAGLLVDHGNADIWVGHRKMNNVDFPREIPRRWINRIRSVPGVASAEPYLLGHSNMTLPDGGFEPVLLVGSDRTSLQGNAWNVQEGHGEAIREPDAIIIDVHDAHKLNNAQIGDLREIGGRRARVAARSEGILGFLVTPYAFTSFENARRYLNVSKDVCSYFLVQLEPGSDADKVCEHINTRLPEVEAYTKKEYSAISVDYWITRTGIGISFGAATLLGLLVGMVIVAQTLYASVLDRIGEFGTLKAIGAADRQIYMILFLQAVLMATVGCVVGLAAVAGIQWAFSTPRAPIVIPMYVSLGSCSLVYIICLISSFLPYLRIRRIDPAMVLQS